VVKVPFAVSIARAREAVAPQGAHAWPSLADPVEASGPTPRLEWHGVEAGYDGEPVLHEVTTGLGATERVAVLGPNGSGKTTLFKAAIGLVALSSGEVLVDGAPTAGRGVAELAATFGYVFQNPSQMLFAPTVRDEILFGPRNLGGDPARFEALVGDSLARVGLGGEHEIRDRPPLTLSFGQQKRLAIAVALALAPRTLVLDEPSAGQDHRSATAFMKEVGRIDGLESVYFVTHDADLALANADRILLMRDGRIVADGAPLEVIADRERWAACNLRYTSLMEANARWGTGTGRFLPAEELAQWVVSQGLEGGLEST